MSANPFGRRIWLALGAVVIVGGLAFAAPPGAGADDPCLPEQGCVPPVVAPPLSPDEAGDPQAVTIEATQIAPVAPYVIVPMPPYSRPKACRGKHKAKAASPPKKCKKRHRAK